MTSDQERILIPTEFLIVLLLRDSLLRDSDDVFFSASNAKSKRRNLRFETK